MSLELCWKIRTEMESRKQAEDRLKRNMLAAMVEAALQGHTLGEWETVDGEDMLRYQAVCDQCSKSVYASSQALYSILADNCPDQIVSSVSGQ